VKDDRLYLIHICECIGRIERYTVEGKETFLRDEKTQDAVLHNLQTLAESTQRLSDAAKGQRLAAGEPSPVSATCWCTTILDSTWPGCGRSSSAISRR